MKKYTRDFLFNLENKTTIKFDWSNLKPTEKYVQQNNQAVEADTMLINKKLITIVISCGCKTCKEVIGLQIFYGYMHKLRHLLFYFFHHRKRRKHPE